MTIRYQHSLWLFCFLPAFLFSKSPVPSLLTLPVREVNICPRPELLQANFITDSSAQLTWTDLGDQFEVELREAGQPLTGTPTHFVAGSPPLQVNGLIPGQQYLFQVRVVCPDNSYSEWSAIRTFATDINNARPCPLSFDLRDTTCAGGGQFFNIHVDNAPGNSLGNDVTLRGIRIMIEHPWRSDLKVWLWSPDSTRIQILGGLNAGDKNVGNPAGSPCAQYVELTEQPGALPLSTAAEQDNFTGYYLPYQSLAPFLNGQNPNGVWKLEICDNKANDKGKLRLFGLVFAPAACSKIEGAAVFNVTESSASLSWTPGNAGDSLVIEYGAAGFYPGENAAAGIGGTVIGLQEPVSQPFVLSGLSTLVHYEIYLRRRCAPGVWGANSEALRFFTNCPPTLLEDVDTLATCPSGCADPCPLPGLWQNVPDDDYEWKVRTGHGLTYPVAGPAGAPEGSGNYLYFRNSCSPTGANGKKAILRTLCVQVNAPAAAPCHFSLDLYMNTKTGQMGSLALQASVDGGLNWQTVKIWSGNQGKQWRREYVNLSAYNGKIALFQLVASGVFGAYGDIAIDNLTFYGSEGAGTPDYTFFRDADGDGFGDSAQRVILCNPAIPPGYVATDGDCDDSDGTVYPGAPEILCNQKDENCNGPADDGLIAAPGGTGAVICSGQTAVLNATGTPLGQFFWFEQAQGGLPVGSGAQLLLNGLNGTKTFFLQDSITGSGGGCTSARTPVVATVNPSPSFSLSAQAAICLGQQVNLANLSIIDLANTGGTYTWHSATPPTPANQLSSLTVQPSVNTVYYLLSTTGAGCTAGASLPVTVNGNPSVQILQGDSVNVCRGKSVNLTAAGAGAAPLTYTWSNGLKFANIPVQASQTPGATVPYAVTVIDANGCKSNDLIKVHTLTNVTQTTIVNVTNPSFCGGTNGSITLQPLDGVPPYTFSWSGPVSGALFGISGSGTINGLKQGGYRVTITDASGACSMVLPQIVLNAPGLSVSVDTIIGIRCPGEQTGAIQLNVSGNAPVFHWSNNLASQSVGNLPGGVYSVTITDGNCTQVLQNLEVTAPPLIQIIQNGLQNITCAGDHSGAVDIAVFGATPPYNFHWSNNASSEDIQGLAPGNYTATVTDANNCTFVSPTYAISQPAQLSVIQNTIQHVKCFGGNSGALSIGISGGVAPYLTQWNNGAASTDLNNIPAGNYSATITDANGCTRVFQTTISQPAQLFSTDILKENPSCVGAEDGRIEVVMSGGTQPYHFFWSNGQSGVGSGVLQNQESGIFDVTVTDAQGCSFVQTGIGLDATQLLTLTLDSILPVACFGESSGRIAVSVSGAEGNTEVTWNGISGGLTQAGIPAGPYIVQISDERGCSIRDTFLVTQPKSLLQSILVSKQNALCAGEPNGNIEVFTTGGTPPYSFAWSNDAVAEDLPALSAGNYTLSIADAHGCTAVLGPVDISEPPALSAVPLIEDIPCFGLPTGSITLNVSGGIPPYHYHWSKGDTTQNVYFLAAGTYNVTVLDAIGCAQILTDLNVVDKRLFFLLQTLENQPVSCPGAHDGKIVVQALNGAPPYQFAWSPPVGLHANVPVAFDQASGLSGGNYTVTVTDAAGCAAISDTLIVEEAPTILFSIASNTNVLCKGDSTGAITTALSGGLPPYSFLWSNGAATQDLQMISAGNYTMTVTDFLNCQVVSPPVKITQPASALQIVPDSVRQDKCGDGHGAIFQHVLGGTPSYMYAWNSGQNTPSVTGLPAGQYQMTLTDQNGCSKISQPYNIQALATPLQIAATIKDVTCFGEQNGAVTVQGSGGTPVYSYFWNNGLSGAHIENLPAGTYILTMTDAAGCTATLENEVQQPPAIAATWASDSTASGWTATLSITGGAEPYEVQWGAGAGNQSGPVAEGLATGVYSVTITDAKGCISVIAVSVGTIAAAEPGRVSFIRLAPNPSFGAAMLDVVLYEPGGIQVCVLNAAGELVFSKESSERGMRHSLLLDGGSLPPGLYFVRVSLENGSSVIIKWLIVK